MGILALGALAWGAGFAWFTGVRPGATPATERTDAIVVLTGDEGRVARGVRLLRAGAAPRLLISGVPADVRPSQIARSVDAPVRLFRCCVDLGHTAIDTRSNAEETAGWVSNNGARSIRLVTSDYHMRRAALELGAELAPDVVIVRDAVPSHAGRKVWAREYSKWLVRTVARRAER